MCLKSKEETNLWGLGKTENQHFYLRRFSESRSSSGSTPSVRPFVRPSVRNTFGVHSLCNLYLQQFSFLYIQILPNDCSYIEDVHLLFCAHLINIFSFFTGVELRHFFPSEMRRGCQVCVICNSNSFHSFIFKLCIMIIHTLKMCISYFVHIW